MIYSVGNQEKYKKKYEEWGNNRINKFAKIKVRYNE